MKKYISILDALHPSIWTGEVRRPENYTILEKGSSIVIAVPVPGCSKDDIELTYSKNRISLSYDLDVHKLTGTAEKDSPALGNLITRGRQDFRIDDSLDPEKATASVINGLLVIEVPPNRGGYAGLIEIK